MTDAERLEAIDARVTKAEQEMERLLTVTEQLAEKVRQLVEAWT